MTTKQIIENLTGYWIHKKKYLPMGTSLQNDIVNRFNYKKLDIIFDIGSNIGQTHKAFKQDFPKSKIYCFEPINKTFEVLQKNIMDVDKNAILENFAFGESIGEKEVSLFDEWDVLNSLNDSLMNKSKDATKQTVSIDTVDNYCLNKNIKKIDLLKIDTEGYELNVLKGTDKLLKSKNVSFILCEVGFLNKNVRNTNFSALSEFLAEYEYFFVSMYNGSNEFWNKGLYYGNALFANSDLSFK